jgi:hypothetical protein
MIQELQAIFFHFTSPGCILAHQQALVSRPGHALRIASSRSPLIPFSIAEAFTKEERQPPTDAPPNRVDQPRVRNRLCMFWSSTSA